MKKINTIRLRAMCGWLGLLLPWIVFFLSMAYNCLPNEYLYPASISITYYYEPTIVPFMIILGSASILLICYEGYEKIDDIINTITGIAGLGICLFPCYTWQDEIVGTFQLSNTLSNWIHNICALVFFVLLAYNVLFLFTKSSGIKTRNKKIRNFIYRICGIGMLVSMICLFIFNGYSVIWWVEAIALMFFGIAFLTKADIYPWLFCDTPYRDDI